MSKELKGKRIAILVTDGFEEVEMTEPRTALNESGAVTRTGRFGPCSGEPSRVAALTAICSRCLLFGRSELISH